MTANQPIGLQSPTIAVALDGPGSSGKSTVGAAAAEAVGYRFFDTGLLYRAVTWLALERGLSDGDPAALAALVGEVRLEPDDHGRLARVLVGDRNVTNELHAPGVDERVSAVSGIAEVRAALVDRQRAIAAAGGIVMAGRDIGTVILPDAPLKLFLDASPEERAQRRADERGLAEDDPARAAILVSLRSRDEQDRTRPVAPLRAATDAIHLSTDGNAFEQTVALVVAQIRAAEARAAQAPTAQPVPPLPGAIAPASDGRSTSPATASKPSAPFAKASKPAKPLPVTPISGDVTFIVRGCALVCRLIARAVTRVRVEGAVDQIPRTGAFILIANHSSNADAVVVGSYLPERIGRRLNWLGKREVLEMPVIGWLAQRGGIHAVDRTAVDVEAFRIAQRILDAGQILAVFPEGTRSADGALHEVKDGLAILAQRSGVPVVPVAIIGADRVWPRGQRLPHRGGRIVIRVGEPFDVAAATNARGTARRAAKGAATRQMMGRLAALLPPRQRGAYADAVPAAEAVPSGETP